jgi:hypothetical protein
VAKRPACPKAARGESAGLAEAAPDGLTAAAAA